MGTISLEGGHDIRVVVSFVHVYEAECLVSDSGPAGVMPDAPSAENTLQNCWPIVVEAGECSRWV